MINLQADAELAPVHPGNFAEVEVPNASDVFLRRPLSVLDVDYEKRVLSFYIKIIGKGTKRLGAYNKGDVINVIYPLGNSFQANGNQSVLIVGGGSGIAPFILLARELQKKNINSDSYLPFIYKDKVGIIGCY